MMRVYSPYVRGSQSCFEHDINQEGPCAYGSVVLGFAAGLYAPGQLLHEIRRCRLVSQMSLPLVTENLPVRHGKCTPGRRF